MSLLTEILLMDIIGLIVAVFVLIYTYFQWSFQIWKRKKVPYFEPSFPDGNRQPFHKAVPVGQDLFNIVEKAKEKGWRFFGMFFSAKPMFVPVDLEIVKCILTKDFNHFTDRGTYYNEKDDPLSAHLFSIGGIKWRNLRTKITPTFTSGKMKGMFQTLVDSSLLLEKFLEEQNSMEPIDIKHVLGCFSTDVIGSCAFGLECNSFNEPDAPFLKYGRKVLERTRYQQFVFAFSFSFPNLARALHMKLIPPDVTSFFYNVVSKTVGYREKENVSRNDFLQLLIEIRRNNENLSIEEKGNGTTLTMDEMVAQSFVFFFAGFETSSTTMTFALFEMSQHPEIQEKVRQELFRVLKKYDKKICYDSIKELEYMQQVIDETLRKYPPLSFITRECVEDYKIPDTDVTLEKGMCVIIPIRNIHYDEKIYENPTKFDPDRFSAKKKHLKNQFSHIPFGEGPRICIGLRFGLMQTKVGLATVLRNYRVTFNSKTRTPIEMDPKSFITSAKGGVWLNLERL